VELQLKEGNKRLVASGMVGAFLTVLIASGRLWGWDELWWWDKAIEQGVILDGFLGGLGAWGKLSHILRGKAEARARASGAIPRDFEGDGHG
jgi:hypothetical protein